MYYWDTGDSVTDKNLAFLEHLIAWETQTTPERTHDLAIMVINVSEMLPALVKRHFRLPSPYIGDGAYRWSEAGRIAWVKDMCEAIAEGIEGSYDDPALKKENAPDLTDRPKSVGEAIIEALDRFEASRADNDLIALSVAIRPTNLLYDFQNLEKAHRRKRPARNTTLEGEVYRAISRLRSKTSHLHREKA